LLFAIPGNVHASLLGDDVTISINGDFSNNPTVATVGPGTETTFTGLVGGLCDQASSGEFVSVDVDSSSIIITLADPTDLPFRMCDESDVLVEPAIITISDMHWVDSPSGQIVGITPEFCGIKIFQSAIVTDPHSVQITFLTQGIDFFSCTFELEIQHPEVSVPVGGEIIPIESTSLILAGAQTFSWMIPVILSGIGIGLFVVSRKSENS